jgi:hypothetical protein
MARRVVCRKSTELREPTETDPLFSKKLKQDHQNIKGK